MLYIWIILFLLDFIQISYTQDGSMSSWLEWSACSATCGWGSRKRSRSGTNTGYCDEWQFCSEYYCPGTWTLWEDTGSCSVTCGGGIQIKQRKCKDINGYHSIYCDGLAVDSNKCNIAECIGMWTAWEDTGSCSVTCGGGIQMRQRQCKDNYGNHSIHCDGAAINSNRCNIDECTGTWTVWEDTGSCSVTCGGGIQMRQRQCKDNYGNHSIHCDGAAINSNRCNIDECTGTWTVWEDTGSCSVTCGGGIQMRQRQCKDNYGNHSIHCDGAAVSSNRCNIEECIGDWTNWENAGGCSVTCGEGVQTKVRKCEEPNGNSSIACNGNSITSVDCNDGYCPVYKWYKLKNLNLTIDEKKDIMKEELLEIKANLTVDPKNTSLAIRKRISARDVRPSAVYIGYIGAVMITVPVLLIVSFDLTRFCQKAKKMPKRQKSKVGVLKDAEP